LLERLAATAAELGTAEAIGVFERLEPEGLRQLEVGRANGLQAVSADVVERSVVS
jgi:hypothetical protein